jgi:hypothetical protein
MAPPLPPVPGALEIRLTIAMENEEIAYVKQYYSYTGGPPSVSDCVTLATAAFGNAVTYLKSLLSTERSLVSCIVTDLSSLSGARGTYEDTTVGTRAGDPLAPSTSVISSYQISRRYRGGKPRNNWPLGTADDMGGVGEWGAGSVTAFNDGIADYIDANTGLSASSTTLEKQINISYFSGIDWTPYGNPTKYRPVPKPLAVPIVDNVDSIVVRSAVGSVRRRNRTR